MKRSSVLIYVITSIVIISCERVKYFPDNPINIDSTLIIAHRGSGMSNNGNTLNGCIYGINMLDGIECDIQMSANNTIWLSHSSSVDACGPFYHTCFASTSDYTIIKIDTCLGPEKNYTRLEEVFEYISTYFPYKYISLDVKAWWPCASNGINLINEMNELAKAIINLTKKYHLENKVKVEATFFII